jgi:hypothetical protein
VILGSAMVLKFVVLVSLAAPAGSRTARVVIALFDAATFGAVAQDPTGPASGYLAFLAIALFLGGISALPAPRPFPGPSSLQRVERG